MNGRRSKALRKIAVAVNAHPRRFRRAWMRLHGKNSTSAYRPSRRPMADLQAEAIGRCVVENCERAEIYARCPELDPGKLQGQREIPGRYAVVERLPGPHDPKNRNRLRAPRRPRPARMLVTFRAPVRNIEALRRSRNKRGE